MSDSVQVYQWHEIEDKRSENVETGDHDSHTEKTYSYDKDWFEYHIDSCPSPIPWVTTIPTWTRGPPTAA